jgi:hypothetical protein
MVALASVDLSNRQLFDLAPDIASDPRSLKALLLGEVLLKTQPYTAWGASVTAQMYLPRDRATIWQQLTNYPRWVEYFPALSESRVLSCTNGQSQLGVIKRLHQVASKNFLLFTARADVYLDVVETAQHRLQFHLASGSFNDFFAELKLQRHCNGIILTYFVQATPIIPVPSVFIQQAIQFDLPANMRNMRQVLCR